MESVIKTATVSELKDELQSVPPAQVLALCLRLAKFKKENKELLTYLLFEAHDLPGYMEAVKREIDRLFSEINSSNIYFAKKTIQKILSITNKHIRYTGSKHAETELLLYFCISLKASGIPIKKSTALINLLANQIKKIEKSLAFLHEDLQYDYIKAFEQLKAN
ncbi:hypothetical protein [Agriterribacter sp.]|uniref:hypothetical protein n=1 Tax=Agriterribacter sp. TaxID=2821509 RepID=UPI002C75FA42|nr:hypothetical protein [Agriterribacter sp.]HRO45720.1 hypothetical protein [Agriterribacter sp.]HRQ15802.1 hypothetical protein [Agriterribacter sp.]